MIDLLLWDFLSADGTFLPRPQYPCMCVHSLRVVMCVLQAFPLLQFALTKSRVTSNRPASQHVASTNTQNPLLQPRTFFPLSWFQTTDEDADKFLFMTTSLSYRGLHTDCSVSWLLCSTPLYPEAFLSTMQYSDYCVILWLLWHTPVYSEVFLCVLQYSDYSAILHCILRVFGTLWFLISTLKYATVSWDIPHHFDCYSVL